jgi:hypothetical protein
VPEDENQGQFEIMPLYKYQACPAEGAIKQKWVRDIFFEHKLFFASRTSFNDPFDCVVPSLLQTPGNLVKRFAEEFVDRTFPSATEAEWRDKVSMLMSVGALKGMRQDVQKDVDWSALTRSARLPASTRSCV